MDQVLTISRLEIDAARRLAPMMDEVSVQILAASSMFGAMYCAPEYPIHQKGKHYDVTGFYQRNKGRKWHSRSQQRIKG